MSRDLWQSAKSFVELLGVSEKYLRGEISTAPYHTGPIDQETHALIPALLRLQDLRWLPYYSKPFYHGNYTDGAGVEWECVQKPFISLITDDEALLRAVIEDLKTNPKLMSWADRMHDYSVVVASECCTVSRRRAINARKTSHDSDWISDIVLTNMDLSTEEFFNLPATKTITLWSIDIAASNWGEDIDIAKLIERTSRKYAKTFARIKKLPVELLLSITDRLPREDLRSFGATCKHLHGIVIPVLFSSIMIPLRRTKFYTQATRMLATFKYSSFVQTVVFTFPIHRRLQRERAQTKENIRSLLDCIRAKCQRFTTVSARSYPFFSSSELYSAEDLVESLIFYTIENSLELSLESFYLDGMVNSLRGYTENKPIIIKCLRLPIEKGYKFSTFDQGYLSKLEVTRLTIDTTPDALSPTFLAALLNGFKKLGEVLITGCSAEVKTYTRDLLKQANHMTIQFRSCRSQAVTTYNTVDFWGRTIIRYINEYKIGKACIYLIEGKSAADDNQQLLHVQELLSPPNSLDEIDIDIAFQDDAAGSYLCGIKVLWKWCSASFWQWSSPEDEVFGLGDVRVGLRYGNDARCWINLRSYCDRIGDKTAQSTIASKLKSVIATWEMEIGVKMGLNVYDQEGQAIDFAYYP